MHRIYSATVFRRQPKAASMESTLTNLFHRVSAIVYFIYTVWGVFAITQGLPSLAKTNGEQWQVIFSIVVTLCTAPAAFGAAFWPAFARLELFAGGAFVTLCAWYIGNIFISGPATLASPILLTSVLALPAARIYVIIKLLLKQADADENKKSNGE